MFPARLETLLALHLVIALLSACSGAADDDAPAAAPEPAAPAPEPAAPAPSPRALATPSPMGVVDPDDPLAELAEPVAEGEVTDLPPADGAQGAGAAIPSLSCVAQGAPIPIAPQSGPSATVWSGEAFVVAAYLGERLVILRVRPGQSPAPIGSVTLRGGPPSRTGAPAIASLGDGLVAIAFADHAGAVWVTRVDASVGASRPLPFLVSERGLDPRYALALSPLPSGALALAWADGRGGQTRLALSVVQLGGAGGGEIVSTHDLTQEGGGAAAPTFLRGAARPTLLFVDPRAGLALIYRTELADDGAPSPVEIVRPLGLPATPLALAAARAAEHTLIAYTATGALATRAIGLVGNSPAEAARPLVAGLGYGDPLVIDALSGSRGALFAMEAPSRADADAPHEVRVRLADASAMGEPFVVPAPARAPSVAASGTGQVAVTYQSGLELRMVFLRCTY